MEKDELLSILVPTIEDEELKKFYKELKDKDRDKNFKKASKEKIKEMSERLGI
ncbi:hypothetical protein F356_126 [Campylobacter phage F356]|uniref:Uncharacterized protein n=2 Tax=Fletchervirus CPX TaxID=1110702 RepID=A0A7T3KER6_9CAUD|nr:hypothetical protein F355_070 [Campylobacter phage F355]QPX63764.1 hypothetical protein F356_126 [Campylobacter phage F356]QQV87818.1 hypothetical protein [Campylobacter phage CJLB-7]